MFIPVLVYSGTTHERWQNNHKLIKLSWQFNKLMLLN